MCFFRRLYEGLSSIDFASLTAISKNVGNVSKNILVCWYGCIDKLRRSMPNLIRAPSMPSVPSIPCLASPVNPPSHGPSSLPTISSLRSSQSFDSSSGLTRLQSSSKSRPHGSSLLKSECRALFSEGMALQKAVMAVLSRMVDFQLTVLLLCCSSFPRAAQSAGPERGELPHNTPTPTESHSLRKPHRAAGPNFPLAVLLYQPALHPQQCRAASAPQTQQHFGTTASKSQQQPAGHPSQLASTSSLLCRNKWSSPSKQNHTTHTQVRRDILSTDVSICLTWLYSFHILIL